MSLDDQLIAMRAGAPGARGRLADSIVDVLEAYFRSRRLHGDFDDLLQDTLVVVLAKIDTFEPTRPGAFEHFVLGVARNKLLVARRRWAREGLARVVSPPWHALGELGLTTKVARRELLELIEDAVAELRTLDRRTIRAWLDEQDWQAWAEREAVPRTTLRTRLHRALARLRGVLRRRHPGLVPETSH